MKSSSETLIFHVSGVWTRYIWFETLMFHNNTDQRNTTHNALGLTIQCSMNSFIRRWLTCVCEGHTPQTDGCSYWIRRRRFYCRLNGTSHLFWCIATERALYVPSAATVVSFTETWGHRRHSVCHVYHPHIAACLGHMTGELTGNMEWMLVELTEKTVQFLNWIYDLFVVVPVLFSVFAAYMLF